MPISAQDYSITAQRASALEELSPRLKELRTLAREWAVEANETGGACESGINDHLVRWGMVTLPEIVTRNVTVEMVSVISLQINGREDSDFQARALDLIKGGSPGYLPSHVTHARTLEVSRARPSGIEMKRIAENVNPASIPKLEY